MTRIKVGRTPGESSCAIVEHCRLKGVLPEAVRAFHGVLDRYTLADIARDRKTLAGILHFHPSATAQSAPRQTAS